MGKATATFILLLFLTSWKALIEATDQSDQSDHHDDGLSNQSHLSNDTKNSAKRFRFEPYLYGTISVAFVSLLALLGIIVIPFLKRKVLYDGVMLTFMSLAVGTMTSDALLHLIPESFGLDEHDEDDTGDQKQHEGEEHDDSHSSYLGKMVVLLAALYLLYMLELIMHTVTGLMKKPKISHNKNIILEDGVGQDKEAVVQSNWADGLGHSHSHSHSHSHPNSNSHTHSHLGHSSSNDSEGHTILGLKSVAFVIVISDAMHNFTDGLAIGAAFANSSAAGLGVTIAVVCHEIPHEIGNFAVLLNTGMSFKKALLLNFLSAVTSFAGLYPGIVAGDQAALSRWIFAAVAAGFLYVALVHMLRELQHFGSLPWHLTLILQNVGMLVGFVIIWLVAIYEHELNGMA